MKLLIKEVAKKHGKQLKSIGKEIGISKVAMSYYSNNHRSPSLSTLQDMADNIGCDVIELIQPSPQYDHFYDSSGEWQGIRKK